MHVQHVLQDKSAAAALVTYVMQLVLGTDGSIAYEAWTITAAPDTFGCNGVLTHSVDDCDCCTIDV